MQNRERSGEGQKSKPRWPNSKVPWKASEEGLSSLKTKAYDNVSEKLQVFEDEFFADLTKRSSAMQEEIDSWKREVRQQLEENARLTASEVRRVWEKNSAWNSNPA
jgi:hypothetical protein